VAHWLKAFPADRHVGNVRAPQQVRGGCALNGQRGSAIETQEDITSRSRSSRPLHRHRSYMFSCVGRLYTPDSKTAHQRAKSPSSFI
jgi:hypothetical protein